MNKGLSLLFSLGCYAVGSSLICNSVIAQVTADGTTNTTVSPDGSNNFTIENGDRAGGNLFHSFDQFSVPSGGSAVFNNAPEINNIFSRVTGGNISNIDGLIRANGSADLFLVNPAGILFGSNSRLDIGGSFFGTTADSILFEDGEFSAVNNLAEPILTVNAPIGLNFRDNPSDIVHRAGSGLDNGGLQVDTRGSLTLVGGNIRLEGGKLTAPGGSIELGGLSTAGTVDISEDGSLSFTEEIAKANISLTDSALVNVVDAGRGSINVNAQNLELSTGSRLIAGIDEAVNSPTAQAGDINLNITEAIIIDGPDSGIFNDVGMEIEEEDVTSSAVGDAGKINIETGSLSITSGGRIGSTIFGQGDAGDVTINASENVDIQGFEDGKLNKDNPTGIFSNLEDLAKGDSGTIRISSDSLNLSTKGQLRTSIGPEAEGTGGDIIVETGSLTLNNTNTRFSTSVGREAKGDAGNIEINADTVSLNSGIFLESNLGREAVGNAGNIKITANSLTLTTTTLKEDSRAGNKVALETNVVNGAKGNAGDILIQTDSLSLRGTSSLNSVLRREAEGNSGNIIIETGSLFLDKDSFIRTTTQAMTKGNAGNIKINANTAEISDGATISSTIQGEGNAGNIELNASDSVIISGATDLLLLERIFRDDTTGEVERTNNVRAGGSAGILSSVEGGASGKGGNITIETPNLKILDGAIVSAEVEAEGQGEGGSIFIDADTLEIGDGGQIIVSSLGNGNAGNINLNITDSIRIFGSDPTFSERFQAQKRTRDLGEIKFDGFLTQEQGRKIFSNVGIGDESQISGIFANSQSQGSGGTVNIQAGSLTLEDEGRITAETNAGDGGNIILEIDDTLSMSNNSLISAEATSEASGGNVNIDSDFIVAFPNQIDGDGSDIIASAVEGEGGRISINAQSLIGIQEGEAVKGNQTNDIDASSEFSLDGTVSINTPDINPLQGATELPTNVVEPEQTVAQACAASRDTGVANSFVVKGKGGIPAIPTAPIASEIISINGELVNNPTDSAIKSSHAIPTSQGDIIPARGIMKTEDGQIILTAVPVAGNTSRIPNGPTNCGNV